MYDSTFILFFMENILVQFIDLLYCKNTIH